MDVTMELNTTRINTQVQSKSNEQLGINDENLQLNISQLQVIQTLGEGAFGEVKLLIDRNDPDICVAVKLVDLKKHGKETESAFRREALLQRVLRNHRNVLKYITMRVNTENQFQLFLEYADGGELFDQIEPDIGIRPDKAKFFFAQLLDGLEYIHTNGICHRDLKPENILLTKREVLKISDFGMATIFRHNGQERLLDVRCGSLPYMAPEVLRGRYRGEPIDVWSCGVILITLLVGQLPWESPEKSCAPYRRWVEKKALDCRPWNHIDTKALSLLNTILHDDPETRYSIAQIRIKMDDEDPFTYSVHLLPFTY